MEKIQISLSEKWSDEAESVFDKKIRDYLENGPNLAQRNRWWERLFMVPELCFLYFTSKYKLRSTFRVSELKRNVSTRMKASVETLFALDSNGKMPVPDIRDTKVLGFRIGRIIDKLKFSQATLERVGLHFKITKVFLEPRIYCLLQGLVSRTKTVIETFSKAYLFSQFTKYVEIVNSTELGVESPLSKKQHDWLFYTILWFCLMKGLPILELKVRTAFDNLNSRFSSEISQQFDEKFLKLDINYAEGCQVVEDWEFELLPNSDDAGEKQVQNFEDEQKPLTQEHEGLLSPTKPQSLVRKR